MSTISALDHLAIQNVISLYCEALDSKDFTLLNRVFLPDVVADYPFNSDLQGVDAVGEAIKNRYAVISSSILGYLWVNECLDWVPSGRTTT
jgi:hypothetical protein